MKKYLLANFSLTKNFGLEKLPGFQWKESPSDEFGKIFVPVGIKNLLRFQEDVAVLVIDAPVVLKGIQNKKAKLDYSRIFYEKIKFYDETYQIHLGLRGQDIGSFEDLPYIKINNPTKPGTYLYLKYLRSADQDQINYFLDLEKHLMPEIKYPEAEIVKVKDMNVIKVIAKMQELESWQDKELGIDYESSGSSFADIGGINGFPENTNFEPLGFSISSRKKGVYFDFDDYNETKIEKSSFYEKAGEYLEKEKDRLWAFNSKFENLATYRVFDRYMYFPDTMAYTVCDDCLRGLKYAAHYYLGCTSWDDDEEVQLKALDEIFRLSIKSEKYKDPDWVVEMLEKYRSTKILSMPEELKFDDEKHSNRRCMKKLFDLNLDNEDFIPRLKKYWHQKSNWKCQNQTLMAKYCIIDSFMNLMLIDKIKQLGIPNTGLNPNFPVKEYPILQYQPDTIKIFQKGFNFATDMSVSGWRIDTEKVKYQREKADKIMFWTEIYMSHEFTLLQKEKLGDIKIDLSNLSDAVKYIIRNTSINLSGDRKSLIKNCLNLYFSNEEFRKLVKWNSPLEAEVEKYYKTEEGKKSLSRKRSLWTQVEKQFSELLRIENISNAQIEYAKINMYLEQYDEISNSNIKIDDPIQEKYRHLIRWDFNSSKVRKELCDYYWEEYEVIGFFMTYFEHLSLWYKKYNTHFNWTNWPRFQDWVISKYPKYFTKDKFGNICYVQGMRNIAFWKMFPDDLFVHSTFFEKVYNPRSKAYDLEKPFKPGETSDWWYLERFCRSIIQCVNKWEDYPDRGLGWDKSMKMPDVNNKWARFIKSNLYSRLDRGCEKGIASYLGWATHGSEITEDHIVGNRMVSLWSGIHNDNNVLLGRKDIRFRPQLRVFQTDTRRSSCNTHTIKARWSHCENAMFNDMKDDQMCVYFDISGLEMNAILQICHTELGRTSVEKKKRGEKVDLYMDFSRDAYPEDVNDKARMKVHRNTLKYIALSRVYGQGLPLLAARIHMSLEDGTRVWNAFAGKSADLLEECTKMREYTAKYGVVRTLLGNKLTVNKDDSKSVFTKSVNLGVQGNCSVLLQAAFQVTCEKFRELIKAPCTPRDIIHDSCKIQFPISKVFYMNLITKKYVTEWIEAVSGLYLTFDLEGMMNGGLNHDGLDIKMLPDDRAIGYFDLYYKDEQRFLKEIAKEHKFKINKREEYIRDEKTGILKDMFEGEKCKHLMEAGMDPEIYTQLHRVKLEVELTEPLKNIEWYKKPITKETMWD